MIEQTLANFLSVGSLLLVLGFFVKRWMDRMSEDLKTVCETVKGKVDNKEFVEYKDSMKELREERDKEIAHIKGRVNHHGHEVACPECKEAKADKVVLT